MFYSEPSEQEDLGLGASSPMTTDGIELNKTASFLRQFTGLTGINHNNDSASMDGDHNPRSRSATIGNLHMLPPPDEEVPKATNVLFVGHESAMGRTPVEDLLQNGDNIGSIDKGFITAETSTGYGFGWIEGVYIRCTLSIFGVIMFLRLNWIFAQAGVGGAIGIILYSVSVTSITTMSLSAISTNGKVAAGGVYFMVSRCLGPDVGVIVGLSLFIAQSLAVALNLVGFAEAVVSLEDGDFMVNAEWDAKIFAIIGLVFCFSIAFLGANFEVQSQKVLFVSMLIALLMFFIGVFGSTRNEGLSSGVMSSTILAKNLSSKYDSGESWVTVFGVFFPAATGIAAGSSISGDLKDASSAIPKGTFLAIGTTTIVYLAMGICMAAAFYPEGLIDISTQICAIDIALVPALVYLGVFAAGLSSALALLVGAPRVLMALARDNLVNLLNPFKTGYFSMDEPLRGYCLTVAIALAAILTLDLNQVAPIVTNFYLVQYGFINYAVAAAHFSKAPGWRPSFKYYNAYISAIGALQCLASMFMVGYVTAIITLCLCVIVYQYVVYTKPTVNWGESSQAAIHVKVLKLMYDLEKTKAHVKNWRPQYLFLSDGNFVDHPDVIVAMKLMKKARGVNIVGTVLIGDLLDRYEDRANVEYSHGISDYGVDAFTSVVVAPSMLDGVKSLLQIGGLGKLRPNTVILGYKKNWLQASDESMNEYRDIIRVSFLTRHGVGVVRNLTTSTNMILKPESLPTIDVWWLVEDGGLTVLAAHLIMRHKEYRERNCVMRLFIACSEDEAQLERQVLTSLLSRFRIKAKIIIIDKNKEASEESLIQFKALTQSTDEEMKDEKLRFFVNISDEMRRYSVLSALVIASLPIPRHGVPVRRYLGFLDILSDGRPTILIRGNQDTVLTYAS
jgi:solute carrier family 12 sodium/potassium/chloride transporter 2